MTTLALCGVVVSLQQTLLLPLLADLPVLLDTSVDTASWLVTATLLTGAIATPTVSRLADMYGKRRMMVVALAVSVAGSLLGAFSQVVPLLIAARALQGVGMALIPVGIAIMRDELPREKVPLGVALMSATLAIGAGVGLPLSGLITEHLDWHAIFWVTGIVGMLLLAAVVVVLPESPVRTRGKFDVRGAVLLSIALTAGLLALSKGGHWGWTSPVTLGLLIGAVAVLVVWVPLELRTPRPLVDIRVASRRAVVLVNAASLFVGFALFINMLITILILQLPSSTGYGLGLEVMSAGLAMVPHLVAFALMAPVSAWLIRRVGPQVTLLVGAVVMCLTYAALAFFRDNLTQIIAGSVVVAAGSAMSYSAMPTLIMRAVPVTETASANGLNVLLRAIGTSTASATTAAITTVSVVMVAGREVPSSYALGVLFWLAAGAALGAAGLSVPMLRMREYAEELDRSGAESLGSQARVVRGRVVTEVGRPVPSAVVTVLTPAGQPVDWGQADSEGTFTAAIPQPAAYLVVTAAEGWRPRSSVMPLHGDTPIPPIVLRDRLTMTGLVTDVDDQPVAGALVILTRRTGEFVASIRTDHDGAYEVPRPPNGRYVLTVSALSGAIGARNVDVWEAQRSADLQLGTDAGRIAAPRDDGPVPDYAEPSLATGFAGLLVRDAMVRQPATLPSATTVSQARAAFASDHVHQLLIVDGGTLLGTLERADLDEATGDDPAAAYALLEGRTVGPDRSLVEVHAEMVESGRRRLAVVDENLSLLGLLCLKRKLTGFCTDEGVRARAAERTALERTLPSAPAMSNNQ